jgi:hypothetical protein
LEEKAMDDMTNEPSVIENALAVVTRMLGVESDQRPGIMMFINSAGELKVFDAVTGEEYRDDPAFHTSRETKLEINANGEPELYDTRGGERPMAVHRKNGKDFREAVGISPRHIDARVIYVWTYQGSHCNCIWSNGKHVGL